MQEIDCTMRKLVAQLPMPVARGPCGGLAAMRSIHSSLAVRSPLTFLQASIILGGVETGHERTHRSLII